jgi:hypothetical protein
LGSVLSAIPLGLGAAGGALGGGGGGGGFDDGGGAGFVDPGFAQASAAQPMPSQQVADVEQQGQPQYLPAGQAYEVARPIQPEQGNVDLMLEDAHLAAEPTKLAGPAYTVRFRNQGLIAAGRFVVAAVTSQDGQYDDQLPRAVLEVPGLAAGDSMDVVLRLPRGDFNFLILYVDASNAVVETDKTNNAAVIERDAL